MNMKKRWKINRLFQNIRYSNRFGSQEDNIRVSKANSYIHEKIKFDICWKLINQDYTIYTEAIFENNKGRADIIAISPEGAGFILEIETPKSYEELKDILIKKRQNYPEEFTLIVIDTKDFDINKFQL